MYLRDVNLVAKVDIFNVDGILEICKNGVYKPLNPWGKSVPDYIKYSEELLNIYVVNELGVVGRYDGSNFIELIKHRNDLLNKLGI